MNARNFFFGGADYYPDKINYSCDFNGAASLNRILGAPTDNKKCSLSFWIKRRGINSYQEMFSASAGAEDQFRFDNDNKIRCYVVGVAAGDWVTTATFTDTTNWHHYLLEIDAANADAAERVRFTVDNVRQTVTTSTAFTNVNYGFNQNGASHYIGRYAPSALFYLDALVADVRFVDGSNPGPAAFGQYSPIDPAVWVPKFSALTYGNNGFQLDFAASGDLGNDVSGNANDFTSSGMTAANQSTTTPTNP